jgi:hypothetical protein
MGHIKRDPVSGAVAIRTMFDDTVPELADHAWGSFSTTGAAKLLTTDQVSGWDDVYEPGS